LKPYFSFDASYVPPAPVLPVRLAHPDGAGIGIVLPLLVDTGADCTMIPLSTVRALRLPRVGVVQVEGVGGGGGQAAVHAVRLELPGLQQLARVVAFGDEGLVGRDVLGDLRFTYDGRRGRLELVPSRRPSPRRSRG